MQVQVDIGFDQLVKIVENLPDRQWERLKDEVEKVKKSGKNASDMELFLLSAPTFNDKQLNEVAKTRKAINQWRKK